MRRQILGKTGLAALATAALVGASGCTTSADPDGTAPPPGLAFDREQVASDIPQDFPLEADDYVEESFRLVDDSTVKGIEFYIVEAAVEPGGVCIVLVRPADNDAMSACGFSSVGFSGQGYPATEFHADLPDLTSRDGWVGLGSGVWVQE